MKNRIHECLYSASAWADQDGWILTGGLQEYQTRVQQYCGSCPVESHPRYHGLAAGRLWGHKKKLPDEALTTYNFR